MGSVNKVILIGNLGADPELKYTPSQRPLCNLRIATTEVFKDKSGQRQEKTEWHRVTVWGDQAENCNKYLAKGRSVYVEGRLQTRSYDKDGQKHYATDVVADRVVFLGSGGRRRGRRRRAWRGPRGRRFSAAAATGPSDDPGDRARRCAPRFRRRHPVLSAAFRQSDDLTGGLGPAQGLARCPARHSRIAVFAPAELSKCR